MILQVQSREDGSFIISEGMGRKLGGLRAKHVDNTRMYFELSDEHLLRIGKIRGFTRCNQRVV